MEKKDMSVGLLMRYIAKSDRQKKIMRDVLTSQYINLVLLPRGKKLLFMMAGLLLMIS